MLTLQCGAVDPKSKTYVSLVKATASVAILNVTVVRFVTHTKLYSLNPSAILFGYSIRQIILYEIGFAIQTAAQP